MIATAVDNTKTAWLGEFPAHWEVLRIKNLFQEMDSRSETGSEELLSVSHYTGVTLKRESLENEDDHLTNAESLVGYKLVQQGDLVINIMLAWNGSLGISPYNGITSPAYCVYRIKGDNNPEYFGYLFSTNLFKAEFRRHSTGIIDSRLRLYSDKFFSIFTVVPTKNEQDEIVQYIKAQEEKINLFIQKKQRFIELLKEQRQSIINQAVTNGIVAKVKMKSSGISWLKEVPSHWEIGRLKNYCTIKGRIGFRGYKTTDLVDEGEGAIVIGATHIKNGKIDLSNPTFLSWEKYYESPEIMVKPGDILIVQRGSCGVVGYVQEDFGSVTINPSIVLAKDIKINSEYLIYFLQSSVTEEEMKINISQTAVPMLSQFQIGNFKVINPPIEEQKQIVSHIKTETATIDTAIAKAEREIELIREYKEAMIAEAVMGKSRI